MIKKIVTTPILLILASVVDAQTIFKDSFEASPLPTIKIVKLNDTGITWGSDYPSGHNTDCNGVVIEAQDCSYGRDAEALAGTLNKVGGGRAGFDFTKLDSSGNPLPDTALSHTCIRDNVTGLMWEVKTNYGLHNASNTYTWHNTNSSLNGGHAGKPGKSATCYGYTADSPITYCNTQAYVARVNIKGLCGKNDWRLPTRNELLSIKDLSNNIPAIDINYFQRTKNDNYWTSSPYASLSDYAWSINFNGGDNYDYHRHKTNQYYVRLVSPTARY